MIRMMMMSESMMMMKTSARVIVCFDGPGGKKDYDELVDDGDDIYKIVLQC